mmetsp:Transcript_28201/g.66145  ORF Transcript_28201/g.66145 Transcript_28201/m.66145 type:complete len:260 (-) Transcript_28201:159-938(-)
MGMFINPFKPSSGVWLPSSMSATPNKMGYFRSSRYPLRRALIIALRAMAVSTPSATSVVEAKISSIVSPLPSRYPNFRLRESGPKQVPNVSPTPDKPAMVLGRAPRDRPSLLISAHPLVTRPDMALVPSSSPSHIPAARAITFFTAPPTSTPITSWLVYTLKFSLENKSAQSLVRSTSSDAMTTAVATPSQISLANDGPDRKAYDRSSPSVSRRMSAMKPRLVVSMPLDALRTGTPLGMYSFTSSRKLRLYWTGTLWTT